MGNGNGGGWRHPVARIGADERKARLEILRSAMLREGIDAVLLGSTNSLRYFTGLIWGQSERLLGALVTAKGLTYIVPAFERSKVETLPILPGDIATWEEHESPSALVAKLLGQAGKLALDPQLPLFMMHPIAGILGHDRLADASALIGPIRARKSPAEIALIRHAMAITLDVHRKAHQLVRPGVRASEVARFIDEEHRRMGADGGATFVIVSFGEATSLPHGAEGDQVFAPGALVLVDTGCRLDGYHADLTRTYMMDEPGKTGTSAEIARIFAIEKEAQAAAFAAARPGALCETVDAAARKVIEAHGLGPDYTLPGLPHRCGHGIGLEIHEAPNLVRGDKTALATGMCFSNEPMIVVPGKFGIRLEDHFHMSDAGPVWFTEPQPSLTDPFRGLAPLA
ncbi:MAG: Xaa-Pro peptidase family protein [Proteobacteria bacterium]|nr:Xaa-Pro peptidase family protein [Pseudomonadota bacterium]